VTELGAPIPRLEEETEVSVYRIAQEALANAVRHANASRVVVTLAARDGILHLEVADDGRGFDPAARPAVALGLASMEERALALGGRLEIRSAPGAGTTVTLACPLDLRVPGRFKELAAPSPTRSSSPPSTTTIPRAAARD
jgi:two-component system sensor histidine kinase UhpB